MRAIVITIAVLTAVVTPAAAQVNATVARPPAWQKAVTPSRALTAEDARARARAAYLAGKSPEALEAEIRAAFPNGGDEIVATALKEARFVGKAEIEALKGDDAGKLNEADRIRLQAAVDRVSKFEEALSNILRKMAQAQIIFISNLS